MNQRELLVQSDHCLCQLAAMAWCFVGRCVHAIIHVRLGSQSTRQLYNNLAHETPQPHTHNEHAEAMCMLHVCSCSRCMVAAMHNVQAADDRHAARGGIVCLIDSKRCYKAVPAALPPGRGSSAMPRMHTFGSQRRMTGRGLHVVTSLYQVIIAGKATFCSTRWSAKALSGLQPRSSLDVQR